MRERTSIAPEKPSATTPTLPPARRRALTLAALTRRVGATSPAAIAAWVGSASIGALVAEGQKLTTERLLRDGVILAGAAHGAYTQMLPEQRALAPAFDERLIGAAVGAMAVCERKGESRGGATDEAKKLGGSNRAMRRALAKKLNAQRAIVYTTAITLAGADPVRRAALDDAWGAGDAAGHLAASHAALVAILREVVADARARDATVSVTDAWLDAQEAAAAALSDVDEAASARAETGDVAQGDVAWWRGVALWFLKQMADQVDAVHAVDPRVARLPLGGLKSVLRHPAAKKKKKADGAKTDAAKAPAKGEATAKDAPAADAAKPA